MFEEKFIGQYIDCPPYVSHFFVSICYIVADGFSPPTVFAFRRWP